MAAKHGVVTSATIADKEILPEAYYTVATSDYLSQGNDGMTPLKNHESMWKSDKKIRDLYIEYIKQVKTVASQVDGRMNVR
jgi:2',3'-cyclic-nucleotide 2'-phosphodiesterase (5'-nucleotidase family)